MEETKERRRIVLGWFRIAIGLLIFAYGVHLTIFANIGLAPWDCLGMGVAKHTPFNYGISMTLIAVTVLLIDLLMKERIGFGTVIDALVHSRSGVIQLSLRRALPAHRARDKDSKGLCVSFRS